MVRKSLQNVTVKNADKGEVSAVFATLNVVDSDGDVTVDGAFTDGAKVVISAYGHSSWGGQLPVGKGAIRASEDEAVLDGQFFLDTKAGADTFTTVKRLAESGLGEWSYGYDPVKYEFGDFEGQEVRFLKALKVYEVSPVLLGAGVETRTLDAKGMKFADEGDVVMATVDAFIKRASEIMALRADKGRQLGAESVDLLKSVDGSLAKLRALLADAATETTDQSDEVAREWLRFVQFQNANHIGA